MPGLDPWPNTNTLQMVVGKSEALCRKGKTKRVQHDCFHGLLVERVLEQRSQAANAGTKEGTVVGGISVCLRGGWSLTKLYSPGSRARS